MTIVVVLIVILAGPMFAQEDPARLMAKAFVAEEASADPAQALAFYERVVKSPGLCAETGVRAGLGRVRCLYRLGRVDEAKEVLADVEKMPAAESMRGEVAREAKRMRGAAPQEEPIEKRVFQLVRAGDTKSVTALGRPAIDSLKKILNGVDGAPDEPDHLAAAVKALVEMQFPELPDVVLSVLRERRMVQRHLLINAVEAVYRRQPDRSWNVVVLAGLDDPDALTRKTAAGLLYRLPSVPWATWKKGLEDTNYSVRSTALKSLVHGATDGVSDELFKGLDIALGDRNVKVRDMAAKALENAWHRDWDRTEALVERAMKDADGVVRMSAYRTLRMMAPSRRKPYLIAGLTDSSPYVREFCVGTIGHDVVSADVPRIRPLLDDPNEQVRQRAADTLNNLTAEQVITDEASQALHVKCLTRDRRLRQYAGSMLARAGDDTILDDMVPLLRETMGNNLAAALLYIMRHDKVEAMPRIVEVLSEASRSGSISYGRNNHQRPPYSLDQGGIIDWLRERGHRDAIYMLLDHADAIHERRINRLAGAVSDVLTQEEDRPRVLAAVRAAQNTKNRGRLMRTLGSYFGERAAAIAYYLEMIRSNDKEERAAGAWALGRHGSAKDVAPLVSALEQESDRGMRDDLLEAITALADESHVDLLASAMQRSEAETQRTFVRALGQVGGRQAVQVLIGKLDDRDVDRSVIFSYLANKKVPNAFDVIRGKLAGGELNARERRGALRALGKLGDARAIPIIVEAIIEHGDRTDDRRFTIDLHVDDKKTTLSGYTYTGFSALYDMGAEAALSGVRMVAEKNAEAAIFADGVRMLTFITDGSADQDIIQALGHEEAVVRRHAAWAAGQAVLGKKAGEGLRRLVRDPDSKVRAAATLALRWHRELAVPVQ